MILKKRTAGLSEAALERFVTKARRAAGLRGAVNVLVTTSRDLRLLNCRFRGQDRITDVLSFPPMGLIADFAGDVAISADIAAQNARRLGHSTAEEIKVLALHGILHLAGYNHERDRGQMARKEAVLRRQLNLPQGLIARNADSSEKTSIGMSAKRAVRVQRQRKSKARARNARLTRGPGRRPR